MVDSEAILLARYAQSRDANAFRALFEVHQHMVYAVCHRVLGNREDAEDAAQSCFFQLALKAAKLKAPVAGWLHKVAVNVSVDMLRQRSSRAARAAKAQELRPQPAEPSWEEIRGCVDEAIAELPEDLPGARRPLLLGGEEAGRGRRRARHHAAGRLGPHRARRERPAQAPGEGRLHGRDRRPGRRRCSGRHALHKRRRSRPTGAHGGARQDGPRRCGRRRRRCGHRRCRRGGGHKSDPPCLRCLCRHCRRGRDVPGRAPDEGRRQGLVGAGVCGDRRHGRALNLRGIGREARRPGQVGSGRADRRRARLRRGPCRRRDRPERGQRRHEHVSGPGYWSPSFDPAGTSQNSTAW